MSPTLQPTRHVQAQVKKLFVPQHVATSQSVDWSTQIADVIRNQFGLKPKEPAFMYRNVTSRIFPECYKVEKCEFQNFS